MDERWHGSLFQISDATDENDLNFDNADFRVGTHIDKEEEDQRDRIGTLSLNMVGEIMKDTCLCNT